MKHYLGVSPKKSSSHGTGTKDNWLLGLTTSIFYSHDSLWCYIGKGTLPPWLSFVSSIKWRWFQLKLLWCCVSNTWQTFLSEGRPSVNINWIWIQISVLKKKKALHWVTRKVGSEENEVSPNFLNPSNSSFFDKDFSRSFCWDWVIGSCNSLWRIPCLSMTSVRESPKA